ncbi:MAG: phenylalanine--tRNA ligase subunit beta [Candidatus Nanoarchaeia archaeon]|nr:phenylalanine--tRNA ligase subunit beta [Candidatus Nanoarchaeia archaeon]
MTILTLDRKELEKKVGPITSEILDKITMMGTPVEEANENEISVEIFPNRPDLLSLQNFAKALNLYLERKKISQIKINSLKQEYIVKVDKSVKEVRPYTVCAIVKGLKFDDENIKQIIDIQEKLHNSIGRKRKKIAIGIYPLEKISFPITYKAEKPENIKFQPLETNEIMNANQILKKHPTGQEYSNLLKDKKLYPIFIDSNKQILSMPPIINSHNVGKVTTQTKDIFIECSGFELYYLNKTLNILISSFEEMGGLIYPVKILDKTNRITPELTPQKMDIDLRKINKNLGLDLNEKQITKLLYKMGIELKKQKDQYYALIPPQRTDILHWIDLVEEVAIAYGYNNFKPIIPKISTIAQEHPSSKKRKLISNILIGLGLLEVSSYHLTTKKNIKKIYFDFNDLIQVENSKTQRDTLRHDLLTNLLEIFSENSDATYPQKIFEIGKVFEKDKENKTQTKVIEKEKLSIALTNENVNYTELKQILDYLFKMLNIINYKIENNDNHPAYIKGRSGIIKVGDKEIGTIGEINPRVLKNWKLKMPVVSLELELTFLLNQNN